MSSEQGVLGISWQLLWKGLCVSKGLFRRLLPSFQMALIGPWPVCKFKNKELQIMTQVDSSDSQGPIYVFGSSNPVCLFILFGVFRNTSEKWSGMNILSKPLNNSLFGTQKDRLFFKGFFNPVLANSKRPFFQHASFKTPVFWFHLIPFKTEKGYRSVPPTHK